MKYIYTFKQACKVVSKMSHAVKCHSNVKLQVKVTMSHTKVTMMSNVDVGCSGFEVFSDGFQYRLP